MDSSLQGRVVLIVEDEPLIGLDLAMTFETQGANILLATTITDALVALEKPKIDAAIVDHVLGDGNSTSVCERLTERRLPFIMYSGTSDNNGPCSHAEHVSKPADPETLIAKVKGLLT